MARLPSRPRALLALSLSLAALGCESEPKGMLEVGVERLDFGGVLPGSSATRTIQVTNVGLGQLELDAALEPPSADFTFELAQTLLPPGASTRVVVRFVPSGLGDMQAILRLVPLDLEALPVGLPLSGQGVDASILRVEGDLDFGAVRIGETKRLPLTLTNTAGHALRVHLSSSANVAACANQREAPFCVSVADAALVLDGEGAIEPGASVQLEVGYRPRAAGPDAGWIAVRLCDDSACEIQIPVEGLGAEDSLRCTPRVLEFGQVNPGECLTLPVRCEGVAEPRVTVVGWGPSSTPPTSADFSFEASRVVVLELGDALDIDVTYCPDVLGEDEGHLQIETDQAAPSRFTQVPLLGVGGGPDIELAGDGCDFGEVALIAPARCTALITNVGFDDLEIRDITADTATTGAFTTPGAGATVIPPGGSYEITIEFQPPRVGLFESTVRFHTNDLGEPELDVPVSGVGVDLPSCQFDLQPASLDFGVVAMPRTGLRGYEVRNTGPHDCLVTMTRLEPGTDPEFSLAPDQALQRRITPGATAVFRVQYAPQAVGTHTGAIELSVSSATSPFNRVPLRGTGADQSLVIAPDAVDFGALGLGCGAHPRTVQILNPTSAPATLTGLAWASSGVAAAAPFSLQSAPALPLTLAPGQTAALTVTFTASAAASAHVDALELTGALAGAPFTHLVSTFGESAIAPVHEQRFLQQGEEQIDVLIVLDKTSSMEAEHEILAASVDGLLRFALAEGLDFHVGVTSADAGRDGGRLFHMDRARGNSFGGPFANRIVTARTQPDPETVLAINVQPEILPTGPTSSAGLHAAYLALTPPVLTGHNAGFLRPNATLSVVFVSDEDDDSLTTRGAPSNDVDFYVNMLLALKGTSHADSVSASAIVGTLPSGCSGPLGAALAAPRYTELAERTGGLVRSICDGDFGGALADIAAHAAGLRTEVVLQTAPVTGTLEVEVDGVPLPATSASGQINWTYDSAANAVRFTVVAVPQAGSEVVVRYTPECL